MKIKRMGICEMVYARYNLYKVINDDGTTIVSGITYAAACDFIREELPKKKHYCQLQLIK